MSPEAPGGPAGAASASGLAELAEDLCGVFLGWRLREDYDALLAMEEGALRIDLRRGEAWCDGEPIPALFIAAELGSALEKGLAAQGLAPPELDEAWLDAAFSRRSSRNRGRERAHLALTCRVSLGHAGRVHAAERHTS